MRPEILSGGVGVGAADDQTFAPVLEQRQGVGRAAKIVFDRVAAVALILLLAPVLALIALVIWVEDGGPVIFRHRRIGRNGATFECLKFRSMFRDADERLKALIREDPVAAEEWALTQKLRDDPRVTRVGAFLRSTSLDELPQLFNVLRGDMSLVGPRPIVQAEMARYGDVLPYYLSVRPGVTGLWQVSGRSNLAYDERVALDRDYVQSWSFGRDAAILLKTPIAVFARRGAH